jgi:hypothetical protein
VKEREGRRRRREKEMDGRKGNEVERMGKKEQEGGRSYKKRLKREEGRSW